MPQHLLRRVTTLASMLLGAVVLSSCGGIDGAGPSDDASDDAGDDTVSSELVPAAEGDVDYPLTVSTVHGEVEIEERPERIATLGVEGTRLKTSSVSTAAENPQFEGRTITIAADYGAEYGVEYYTAADGAAEQVTQMLGFDPNPHAAQFTQDAAVSEEHIAELDADVLIVFYTDHARREAREESDLFQQIPAVVDDRYVPVVAEADERAEAGAGWVLRRGASVLGLPWAVEALADWANEADLDT